MNDVTTIHGRTSQPTSCVLTLGSESIAGMRKENQDRVAHFESPFGQVFVLADGMGGYQGGSIASSIAATQLPILLKMIPLEVGPREALVQSIRELNMLIIEKARESGVVERGMGSTVAALLICGTSEGLLAIGAHVGDSRIYFFRGGKTFCLTRDHTVVQQLIDMGSLTPVQAEDHPQASVLTRALGRGDAELAVDLTQWLLLRPDDKLLLCSDGLSGYSDDSAIADIVSRGEDPGNTARELVELALQEGSMDNISVLVIHVAEAS